MAVTRAVVIPEPGGPEVLRVAEREVRDPQAGEVRLAVRAAAVNPTDIGLRQRGADGLDPPWVPGMDAAGVIESAGIGVERLAVGDRVMAVVTPRRPEGGAQAGLVVVPAASVVPAPAGVTLEQAATLPMNGLTALRGLELLDLDPGATLAVTGGAGLLASYVIRLAKRQGLRVLADAKPEDEELVRGYGADEVLPAARGSWTRSGLGRRAASTRCTTRPCSGGACCRRSGRRRARVRPHVGRRGCRGRHPRAAHRGGRGARTHGLAGRAPCARRRRTAGAARRRDVRTGTGRRCTPADGAGRFARTGADRLRLSLVGDAAAEPDSFSESVLRVSREGVDNSKLVNLVRLRRIRFIG